MPYFKSHPGQPEWLFSLLSTKLALSSLAITQSIEVHVKLLIAIKRCNAFKS